MQLAILTPYIPDRLERAESLGLSRIQLRIGPGFPVSTDEEDLAEARLAAAGLRGRGLEVVRIGFYRNMLEPDPAAREAESRRLRHVMRMAADVFGTGTVGVFAGRVPDRSIEDNIPDFRAVWEPLAGEAERLGVRLAFENCSMFRGYPLRGINLSHTPHAYRLMFGAVPSPALGIEFDPSHCLKQCIDPVRFIREFPTRLYSFHAKDHERLADEEYLHGAMDVRCSRDRFPGFGQIDFGAVLAAMASCGYDGPVIIEAERDPDHTTEAEIRTGLRRSCDLLQGSIDRLSPRSSGSNP